MMKNSNKSNRSGNFRSRGTGSGQKSGFGFRGPKSGFNMRRRRPARAARPLFDPSEFVNKASEVLETKFEIKHNFEDFNIDSRIKKNIALKKYVTPTPIQDQIIPHVLEGKDIVGAATTGTGKTAAFLIPLINNVLTGKTEKVIILAPTRELAEQIQQEFEGFKKGLPLYSALCIGGMNIGNQIKQLSRNPQFVIGTPGRLADLEERNRINFSEYTTIVLDEFDTMLSMGFINEIKDIIAKLPKERQTVFFSATMPKKIEKLVDSFLKNPIKISVITKPSAQNVNQEIVKLNGRNKVDVLCDMLSNQDFEKVLVFGGTKRETDKLSKTLAERNLRVAAIHGNKSQDQRRRALNQFKTNKVRILLATDVLSRGLDIDNVSHVINYTLPQTYEDYIHRIGRTGRGSNTGVGITIVD